MNDFENQAFPTENPPEQPAEPQKPETAPEIPAETVPEEPTAPQKPETAPEMPTETAPEQPTPAEPQEPRTTAPEIPAETVPEEPEFTNPFADAPKPAPVRPATQGAQPYAYPQQAAPTYAYSPQTNQPNAMYATAMPQNLNKIIAKKVAMWVAIVVVELVLLLFAVIGIYSVATGALWQQKQPSVQTESRAERPNGTASAEPQNNSKVQMGITCVEMSDEMAEFYQLEKGLIIREINEDSNAKNVGLELYDVITHCNGVRVRCFQDLFDELEKMSVGDTVTLTVYRVDDENNAGEPFDVSFAVQKRQTENTSSIASSKPSSDYPFA